MFSFQSLGQKFLSYLNICEVTESMKKQVIVFIAGSLANYRKKKKYILPDFDRKFSIFSHFPKDKK